MALKGTSVVGIDPGLVDTGIVALHFFPENRAVEREYAVLTRNTPNQIMHQVNSLNRDPHHVFIEGYRPRSHLNTDARMMELVREIHKAIPGSKVLNNTGIKKVVRQRVLSLFDCDPSLLPATHHGDLMSAARILMLGMYKDPKLNKIIADAVLDHINGQHWSVHYV